MNSKELKKTIIIMIVSGILFAISFILGSLDIVPPLANATLKAAYYVVMLIIAICSFCIFVASAMLAVVEYKKKKAINEATVNIQALSKDFSEIKIYDKSLLRYFISNEDIKCEAKLNDDNTVTYKIKVEVEGTLDDVDIPFFLDNFKIN